MNSSDLSVLTVGGLVFSSDPRVGLLPPTLPGGASGAGTWTLQVANTSLWDSGDYLCMVNNHQEDRVVVELVVRGG